MTIEALENELMTALLAGDAPELEALRAQYAAATVKDRAITESGFTTYFDVPSSAAPIARKQLHLDDLQIELEGAATPAEVSLEVRNGRLRALACSLYDGLFPRDPRIRTAWYYGTERYPGLTRELMAERDVEELLEDDE